MSQAELKEFFKRNSVTHVRIARELGCTASSVNAILNGYYTPSERDMRRLKEIQRSVLAERVDALRQDVKRYAPSLAARFMEAGA
ncbi:hypothetical protein JCM15519_04640 [Fundidesulfovibrio butyratiphilus]